MPEPTPTPTFDWSTLDPSGGAIASIIALLRLLGTPPDAPDRPAKAWQHPDEAAKQTVQSVYWWLVDHAAPSPFAWALAYIAGTAVLVSGTAGEVLLWLIKHVGTEIAADGLMVLDDIRKDIDPTVAKVATLVLNELLGTDYTADHLNTDDDIAGHIARAGEVGGMLHDQLISEFKVEGDVTPEAGQTAARRMSGFLINFGTATGVLAMIGGLVPFIHLDDVREIGEQVARNLGLGRMHRMVMKPLIQTLIGTPYQWQLNQWFHPTQFKEGDLVSPLQQTMMDHDTIFKAMDLLGYSTDKIEQLIKLHSKKQTLPELELFDRYGILSRDSTLSLAGELGYHPDIAGIALIAEDLKRADAVLRTLVDDIESRVIAGQLTTDDFSALLDSLPLGFYEKKFRLQTVQYKVKATHNHLTLAQAQKAYEEGIWTLDQLEAYLTARGYSADDTQTLELITLLALAKITEAKAVAQFAYDKKVAAAKAKGLPIPPPPAVLTS